MMGGPSDLEDYLSCLGFGRFTYTKAPVLDSVKAATIFASTTPPNSIDETETGIKSRSYLDKSWSADSKILLIVESETSSHEADELLEKMASAIGLNRQNCSLTKIHESDDLDWIESTDEHFDHIMHLGQKAAYSVSNSRIRYHRSHSPSDCLKNPGLKKVVWEDLKTFKGGLGL